MYVSFVEDGFPIINAEEVGAIKVGRAFAVEVVFPFLAVCIGREDEFSFSRKGLMKVRHIELSVSSNTNLVEHPRHRPKLMTLFERSPRIAASHNINLLREDITLSRHIVPISILENPRSRNASGTDGRTIHLFRSRVGTLPMEVSTCICNIVFPRRTEVMSLAASYNWRRSVEHIVWVLFELIAGLEVSMPVFVLPKRVSIADGIFLKEVVVDT